MERRDELQEPYHWDRIQRRRLRTAPYPEASNNVDWRNKQGCHETGRNPGRCMASERPTPRPIHKTRWRVQGNLARCKDQGDLRPNRDKHKGRTIRIQIGAGRETSNALRKPGSEQTDTLRARTARGFIHRRRAEPRWKSK